MTKHERAKMMKRLHMSIPWLASGHPEDQKTVLEACVLEVDRAVRVERKEWKAAYDPMISTCQWLEKRLAQGMRDTGK